MHQEQPGRPGPSRHLPPALVLITAGLAAAFIVLASFPGYLNPDSSEQLQQAELGFLNDRHGPFTVLVWWLLLKLAPGAVGYLLLDTLLIWGSCATLALLLRRSLGDRALVLALVPVVPGICNYLGNVLIDATMAGWLLAGACIGFVARRSTAPRWRLVFAVLANLLLAGGVLTRMNALFCVVPLLLYVNQPLGRWRNLLLCAVFLVALPVLDQAETRAVGAYRTGVFDSIKTYHLLALSFREHEVLMPGRWSAEQSRRIMEGCYSPVQWDTAWLDQCHFIFDGLHDQKIWNTPAMTRAWLRALERHPLGFVSIQLGSFKRSMFLPNSPALFWPTPNRWNDVIVRPPDRIAGLWRSYILSADMSAISRPWIMVALSCVGTLLILRRPRPFEGSDGLAIALLLSGEIYLAGFFAYGVSAEYRYYVWSGFCAVIGLVLALLGMQRHPMPAQRPPVLLAGAAIGVAVLAGAPTLTAWAFQLPQIERVVSVRPSGPGPIRVQAIHAAATPPWLVQEFEGTLTFAGWRWQPDGFASLPGATALRDRLLMPREDVEILLASGPGLGPAIIEADGRRIETMTASVRPGTISVLLPPDPGLPLPGSGFSLRWTGGLLGTGVLLFLGAWWLTMRRGRWGRTR